MYEKNFKSSTKSVIYRICINNCLYILLNKKFFNLILIIRITAIGKIYFSKLIKGTLHRSFHSSVL